MYYTLLWEKREVEYSGGEAASVRLRNVSRSFSHQKKKDIRSDVFFGGDKRDRTADLLNAIQALSQLSYTPIFGCAVKRDLL